MQNRHEAGVGKRQTRRSPAIHVLQDQVALRVVCHSTVVGGIIGSNGHIVSQLRRDTGAKIHCHQPAKGSDHCVVIIVGSTAIDYRVVLTDGIGRGIDYEEGDWVECEVSTAQAALIRVSERVWEVLEEEDEAYCGILADRTQIGAVLGKGGNNVEWIRKETGAQIRVLPPPACGTNNDELIQVTGGVLAVKKALVMVSGCLQDCPPVDGYPPPLCSKPIETFVDVNAEDPHSRFFPNLSSLLPPVTVNNAGEAASSRHLWSTEAERTSHTDAKDTEQEVVFKIICSNVAAGGIIGAKGSVVRALQNETGASVILGAPLGILGDRIVTISARENLDSWYSPAQHALILVFTRSVEIDAEKGVMRGMRNDAIVKARLLVPSYFGNCLSEERDIIKVTGAAARVLGRDQIPDCISENEVVIEIVGNYKDVRSTLSQVSSKLRDKLSPKDDLREVGTSNLYGSAEPGFPTYHQPSNISPDPSQDSIQTREMASQALNQLPWQNAGRGHSQMNGSGTELQKSLDFLLPVEVVKEMGRRSTNGELKDAASSELQENGLTQGMEELKLSSYGKVSSSPNSLPRRKQSVTLKNVTVEIAVREDALATLYGRDGCGLSNLQQVSGVKVEVRDSEGGEGTLVISGSPEQTRWVMGLIVSVVGDQ